MSETDEGSELYDEREYNEAEYYREVHYETEDDSDYTDDDDDYDDEEAEDAADNGEGGVIHALNTPPPVVDSVKLNDFCNTMGPMDKKLVAKTVKMVKESFEDGQVSATESLSLEEAVLGAYLAVYKRDFVEQAQSKFPKLKQMDIKTAADYFESTLKSPPECKYCGWDTELGLNPNNPNGHFIVICKVCRKQQVLDGKEENVGAARITDPDPRDIHRCVNRLSNILRGMGFFYREEMKDMIKDRLTYSYNMPVLPLLAHLAGAYIVVMVKSYRERIRLWKVFPKLTERQVHCAIVAFDPTAQ